jgi:hypothetical protein
MKFRIHFFDKQSGPNAPPTILAHPSRDFGSLDEARKIALADADRPTIMAYSILIESTDDVSISETWVRDAKGWKSVDATRP